MNLDKMREGIAFQPLQLDMTEDMDDLSLDEFLDEFDHEIEDTVYERKMNSNAIQMRHRRKKHLFCGLVFVAFLLVILLFPFHRSPNLDSGGDSHLKEQTEIRSIPMFSVQKSDGKMYDLVSITYEYQKGDENNNENQNNNINAEVVQNDHEDNSFVLYHDPSKFTQGLTYSKHSDTLFESYGLYGKSGLCRLDPVTGNQIKCVTMDKQYFAEGMQVYTDSNGKEKLIQLTWKSQTGFIYDGATLEEVDTFTFTTEKNEGWGICLDEEYKEFIVSDGSEYLHFWDVNTLVEKRRLKVTRMSGLPAYQLNELEFVHGKVLANVWYEDVILVIDPLTGTCESEYDLSMLFPSVERDKVRADVLNGISISKNDGVLYITGKKWDRMFTMTLKGFS